MKRERKRKMLAVSQKAAAFLGKNHDFFSKNRHDAVLVVKLLFLYLEKEMKDSVKAFKFLKENGWEIGLATEALSEINKDTKNFAILVGAGVFTALNISKGLPPPRTITEAEIKKELGIKEKR